MMAQPTKEERANLRRLLEQARREDLGRGDLTSQLLPAAMPATGEFVAREALVFAGGVFLGEIAAAYDRRIRTKVLAAEGQRVAAGAVLARWTGPARAVLSAERVALNFLQALSGIATATRRYVDAVAGTGAGVYDTRKTLPGWRALAKYAVRCGGGRNHRRGLFDAVLVKDNHLAALAAAGEADPLAAVGERLAKIRRRYRPAFVMVEVDSLAQLKTALALPVESILLDNMPPRTLAKAVAMRDQAGRRPKVTLEASGGITIRNVAKVAATGVERISVGAITHSARAVDVALDVKVG
ncbi:MAG: carboxylating nicotinate-nucleotide diphosphorylase [Planctomycetota bacterium]|nr:carboxylating nicotinate-nucleotide diphosphorylase [Planctomycetota bacterium]